MALCHDGEKEIPDIEREWIVDSTDSDIDGIYNLVLKLRAEGDVSRERMKWYKRALNIFSTQEVPDTIVGRTCVFYALDAQDFDYKESIQYLKRGLVHYKNYYPISHHRITSVLFHLAEKHFNIDRLEEAKAFLDTTLALQWPNKKSYNWARSLLLMSRIYAWQGDLGKSLLLTKVIEPYLSKFENQIGLSATEITAGILINCLLYQEALALLQSHLNEMNSFEARASLITTYQNLNYPDSAILHLDQLLPGIQDLRSQDQSWINGNYSEAYLKKGEFEKAHLYSQRIEFDQMPVEWACYYSMLMVEIETKLGNHQKALDVCNKMVADTTDGKLKFPFVKIHYYTTILNTYFDFWRLSNDWSYLDRCEKLLHHADSMSRIIRHQIGTPLGRQNFSIHSKSLYDIGIRIWYSLYHQNNDEMYLKNALGFMEANKALVLSEEISERRLEESKTLTYRDKYRDLVALLEKEVDPDVRLAISDSIYYWMQKESNESFTIDSNINNTTSAISIADYNDEKTTFVNYFQHQDSSLSIITISDEGNLFNLLKKEEWYAEVELHLNSIIGNSRSRQTTIELCQRLIPRMQAPAFEDRFVIIPDGLLSYFPFECLDISDEEILIENYEVNYSFSLALHKQVQSLPTYEEDGHIFAPSFEAEVEYAAIGAERDLLLGPLTHNEREAEEISDIFRNSNIFLSSKATKKNFAEINSPSRFIHIATHAVASAENNQEGRIVFSLADNDPTFSLSEIYHSRLPTNMVVLSACQTAVGRYVPGEGVMSFARAFTAAGAKSIIATLWSVNDQSTADIMEFYYQNLRQGLHKNEALRQAKLEYLKLADPAYRHPYYWAGFVAIGDMSPIITQYNMNMLWPIMVVLSIVILFVLSRQRKITS